MPADVVGPDDDAQETFPEIKMKIADGEKPSDSPERSENILMRIYVHREIILRRKEIETGKDSLQTY